MVRTRSEGLTVGSVPLTEVDMRRVDTIVVPGGRKAWKKARNSRSSWLARNAGR